MGQYLNEYSFAFITQFIHHASHYLTLFHTQNVKQDNTTFLVIQNNGVTSPSFSLREYIPAARMAKVSTRPQLDIITFSNTGKIYIEGRIVMKLADRPGRKLQADNTDSIADGNEAASFDLVVC